MFLYKIKCELQEDNVMFTHSITVHNVLWAHRNRNLHWTVSKQFPKSWSNTVARAHINMVWNPHKAHRNKTLHWTVSELHPWGCCSAGRALAQHVTDIGSISRCGQGVFSQSQLSVQTLSYSVHTPSCEIACVNICAHVKDPGAHVRATDLTVHDRVWWIMKHLTPSMHRKLE